MRDQTRVALEASAQSIVQAFGERAQIIQACEEMSELTTQLCKWLNFKSNSVDAYDHVVEEIADVTIMMEQLSLVFGLGLVDDAIIKKLDRTLERIRQSKGIDKSMGDSIL